MHIEKQKKIVAKLSIASNSLIIVLKLIAGVISGSISIISEAIHSMSDFLASVLTFFAVTRSAEPADKEHPFGHGKYEDMSGFIEGGLIIFAALFIIFEASKKLILGIHLNTESTLGIWVMGISVLANFFVSRILFHVAKKSDSISLYADAEHLNTDIYSALGVFIGLIAIKLTGLTILDPIIALIVAFVILRAGFSISKTTLNNLLDGSLPSEDIEKINEILINNCEIKGYSNLKGRRIGPSRDIDLTIFFEKDMTIQKCHDICDKIEHEIVKVLGDSNITIHSAPIYEALKH